MKRNTPLRDMSLACLELQGLDMHFRYIQNDGVADVLKAPIETQHLLCRNRKHLSEGFVEKNLLAEQELDGEISGAG